MSIFTQDNKRNLRKNPFDLSIEKKLSTGFGKLTPILCREVLPGDSAKVDTEIMTRFAPMLAPLMHRVNVFTHYFYVPNRIIWDNWENFISGGEDNDQNPTPPTVTYNEANKAYFESGSMMDYLGFPAHDKNTA